MVYIWLFHHIQSKGASRQSSFCRAARQIRDQLLLNILFFDYYDWKKKILNLKILLMLRDLAEIRSHRRGTNHVAFLWCRPPTRPIENIATQHPKKVLKNEFVTSHTHVASLCPRRNCPLLFLLIKHTNN